MIALNPFSFKKQHFVAWVLVALPLLIANSAARAQSTDATAQEKQHAQNAAAAINRDDWQAAKNELVQAVKLAPSNAVLHYELALAYFHTGLPRSARVELDKALQLGLPADQSRAAQELKEQLNTAPSERKSAGSSSQGPSLDETLNFIQAKLSGIGKLSYDSIATSNETNYTVTNRLSYEIYDVAAFPKECRISINSRWANEEKRQDEVMLGDVSSIKSGSLQEDLNTVGQKLSFHVYPPIFYIVINTSHTKQTAIHLDDEGLTSRLVKAFQHAVDLCKKKKDEPF